jgi:hypothetical protein
MSGFSMAAGWQERLAADSHSARLAAIEYAAETARRVCPRDTGALASTITG